MTSNDLRNVHITRNSCKDALLCVNMELKLPWYFYLLMEKPLSHYFQVWSSYRKNSATRKHLSLYPQGDRPGLRKTKKDKH